MNYNKFETEGFCFSNLRVEVNPVFTRRLLLAITLFRLQQKDLLFHQHHYQRFHNPTKVSGDFAFETKGYISDFNFYQGKFRSMSNVSHIDLMKQCKKSMRMLSMWGGNLCRNSLVSRLDDHLANVLSCLKTLYLYLVMTSDSMQAKTGCDSHLVHVLMPFDDLAFVFISSFDNHFAHVSTRKHRDKSLRKLLEAFDNCLPGQMLP